MNAILEFQLGWNEVSEYCSVKTTTTCNAPFNSSYESPLFDVEVAMIAFLVVTVVVMFISLWWAFCRKADSEENVKA